MEFADEIVSGQFGRISIRGSLPVISVIYVHMVLMSSAYSLVKMGI